MVSVAVDAAASGGVGACSGGRGSGNNRNGTSAKTVLTEIGAVDLAVPRDRNGTFDPKIVPKHARRLDGFNANIVHLYARGLSTRDIRRELARMYGIEVSPELISPGHRRHRRRAQRMPDRSMRCTRSCTSTRWW